MMDPTGLPAPRSFAFATPDLDEARALCWSYYYPISLDRLPRSAPLAFSFRVLRIGPITIGEVACGTEMRMTSPDLVSAYHVNVPLAGYLESDHRGRQVLLDPGRAGTYQPVGQTLLRRWSADCRQLCVKIDRSALEGQLEAVLDRPARVPLDLAAGFDMTGGPGRSWRRLVTLMASEMDNRYGLRYQPIVACARGAVPRGPAGGDGGRRGVPVGIRAPRPLCPGIPGEVRHAPVDHPTCPALTAPGRTLVPVRPAGAPVPARPGEKRGRGGDGGPLRTGTSASCQGLDASLPAGTPARHEDRICASTVPDVPGPRTLRKRYVQGEVPSIHFARRLSGSRNEQGA